MRRQLQPLAPSLHAVCLSSAELPAPCSMQSSSRKQRTWTTSRILCSHWLCLEPQALSTSQVSSGAKTAYDSLNGEMRSKVRRLRKTNPSFFYTSKSLGTAWH